MLYDNKLFDNILLSADNMLSDNKLSDSILSDNIILSDISRQYVISWHCKKSVLKIQEYIHEAKFYIPEFFHFKLLIPENSPI
jgi:hypothetical protein